MSKNCIHNAKCRYTHGFFCEDCQKFFNINSLTYRSSELLSDIWMVLHNINAERGQAKKPYIKEIEAMKNKIGVGIKHKNYEELISEAEILMTKYNKNSQSATVILKGKNNE